MGKNCFHYSLIDTSKRIFTNDAISIQAILHAEYQGKLCTGPEEEEAIFKDPLDTLPHVYAAFLLGVLSFERIQRSGFHEGLRKRALGTVKR